METDQHVSRRNFLFGSNRSRAGYIQDEGGAGAVEYSLLAGVIAMGLVLPLTRNGKRTRKNMNCVKRAMKGKSPSKFCKRNFA